MSFLLPFLSSIIVLAVFLLDRLTKYCILKRLYLGESIDVLPFFQITHVQNTGAAFSMGQEKNRLFIVISIVLVGFLLVLRHRWNKEQPRNWILKAGLALVIGGALGNLYDRIEDGRTAVLLVEKIGEWAVPVKAFPFPLHEGMHLTLSFKPDTASESKTLNAVQKLQDKLLKKSRKP